MATVPFKSRLGFADSNRVILSGVGAPGSAGNSADLIAAMDAGGVGSTWTDITTGNLHTKHTAGAGAANWERLVKVSEVAQLAGGSWREPVKVLDNTNTKTAAVVTAMNAADTLDGIGIVAGDRILLTALTTNPNVYIVGGSTGAWTLTEDANAATAGDVVRVTQGTFAGQAWQFDITGAWVYVDSQTNAEDQFIRAFIGKAAAGAEMPAFVNTNYVTTGTSLETAISDIDGALFTVAGRVTAAENNITALQTELNTVEASVGLDTTGALAAFTGTTYLGAATSIRGALIDLDTALNSVNTTLTNNLATLQAEVDATQTGAGLSVGGAYVTDAAANYIATATSLHNATQLLDTALAATDANVTALQTAVGNTASYTSTIYVTQGSDLVTAVSALDAAIANLITSGSAAPATTIILDSVPVDTVDLAVWDIVVFDSAAKQNKVALHVVALHDGTPTADAVNVDDSDGFELVVGTAPSVAVTAQLNGVGTAQTMQLLLTATANVEAKFKRMAV